LLSYVLKYYRHITTAVIIGFITGSLGVVWPWKRTIFKINAQGQNLIDSNGKEIIANYERYIPDFTQTENWWSLVFMAFGFIILLGLDWYGKHRKESIVTLK
ncbi:hypothetical protein LCGC14_2480080, partial [marine sediment metagenome]